MAKQVIILGSSAAVGGMTNISFALWIVPSGSQVVPNPGFVSAYAGASATEISSLQAGTTVEITNNATYPSSFSLATIEADLLTKYTAAQAAYTSGVNPIQYYGTYYDGVLTSWTTQSLSVVPLIPAVFAEAVWTSATAVNTTLTMSISNSSSVTVAFTNAGTLTSGGLCVFEVSVDNVNWFMIQATTPEVYGTSSSWAPSVGSLVLSFNVAGYGYFRTILGSTIVGSGSVTIVQQASALSTTNWVTIGQPVAAYLQATVTGTVSVNALPAGTNVIGGVEVTGHGGATLDGTVAAGAAPTNGIATLAQYNSSAPAPTTTQTQAIQADAYGNLFVNNVRRSQVKAVTGSIASTTAATLLAAQAAGVFADLANLVLTISAVASTEAIITCNISDGTTTYEFGMATGPTTVNGATLSPVTISFDPPIPATNAATAWTIALSAAAVTVRYVATFILQKAS
jgi:hypothetical protein